MKLQGSQRLEELEHQNKELAATCPAIKKKLTENEFQSPGSEYANTLKQYLVEPHEDKLEMLQNALLNGFYGDYTLNIRQQFYKWVQELQSLDIAVLEYLYKQCANIESAHQLGPLKLEEVYILTSLGPHESNSQFNRQIGGLSIFAKEHDREEMEIKLALSRLIANGLIVGNGFPAEFGTNSPYKGCVPMEGAKLFLDFVKDPRNNPRINPAVKAETAVPA
jgi:hypothetical protein